ncbi:hypothetical protein QZH41_008599 [Actinostola sp. cb2023]|nr:hypothetical protein QZH41_008599 [Actinostola sp. cb2023]
MASLSLLPASTVHRIASSQVITSISVAIKELVENALDAGADNVEVKLEEYGFSRIEVRDNGCGVKPTDAAFMAQRHYTSKISSFQNLNELTTYGFRGEALCSLCSVGNVTITTKTKDNVVAQRFTLGQAGQILSTKPTPSSTGTTVVVNNLFKNLPVRKQFLSSSKKCKEELKKIEELAMAFGSVHPGVRIVLCHNKSIIWQKGKVSDYKTSLMAVFGTSVMSHMEKIEYKDEEYGFEMIGYLPKPDSDPNVMCRTNNDRGFIFINNRPVMMKAISQLVRQHYSQAGQKYPVMFLSIKVPPDGVDVNLEPNKTRVLLTEKERILEAIKVVLGKFYGHDTPKDDDILVSVDDEHCKTLLCSTNDNKSEMLGDQRNESDFHIDEAFTPIASSTLTSIACESLLLASELASKETLCSASLNKTDVNQSQAAAMNLNSSSQESISVNKNSDLIKQPENNSCQTDSVFNSETSTPSDSSQVHVNEEINNQDAVDNNISQDSIVKGGSTGISLSSNHQVSDDKVSNKKDDSLLPAAATAGCTADLNKLSLQLPGNSEGNATAKRAEVNSEDIHQLLDLTEDSQVTIIAQKNTDGSQQEQGCCPQTINNTTEKQSEKNLSFNFDDVFDDDLEFDKILKDIAEKKMLSQSTQVTGPNTVVAKESIDYNSKDTCNNICEKSWSTGNVLKDKQGNLIEPVNLLALPPVKPLNKTTPVLGKRKHSSDKVIEEKKFKWNKKLQRIPQVLNQSMITFHASQSPRERLKEATNVDVSFSMLNLKKSHEVQCKSGTSSPPPKHHLIGWLEPSGVWLMVQQAEIVYVNHCRIQEQILYHKLMQTHLLPQRKAGQINSTESQRYTFVSSNLLVVGGDECWNILINLESQCEFLDSARFITDERIKSNGFDLRIKVDPDTSELKVDVLSVSTSLPFYGIPDLAEILGLIKAKGVDACLLAECRPLKVVNYLKGEAVRICRAQNPRITREDVETLLIQMEEFLPKDVRSCLHEQPFIGQIANISTDNINKYIL